jgi:hypothetical protein
MPKKKKSTREKAKNRLGKLTKDKVPGGKKFEGTRTRELAKKERYARGRSEGMESVESRKERNARLAEEAGITAPSRRKKKKGK